MGWGSERFFGRSSVNRFVSRTQRTWYIRGFAGQFLNYFEDGFYRRWELSGNTLSIMAIVRRQPKRNVCGLLQVGGGYGMQYFEFYAIADVIIHIY